MVKIKQFISRLSIKKKIIFYSYLVVTPIMLMISALLFMNNYQKTITSQAEANLNSVKSLGDSIEVIQTDLINLSTYICINDDITKILTANNPEEINKDSQLWKKLAPVNLLQDMIYLKGYVKTIAIYPENGVLPFLRCVDSSSYLSDIEDVRNTQSYKDVLAEKGKILCRRVPKNSQDIYKNNWTDKIVLYREMFDLSKKKALGYIVIGADAGKYTELCKNILRKENEGILVLNSRGDELVRYGEIEEGVLTYLQSEENISQDYKKRDTHMTYGAYEMFCSQKNRESEIICKLVPKSNINDLWYNIAITPVILLIGFLIGLFPVLVFVSNIISKPLRNVCNAMDKFKNGDFGQRVAVTTQDEVGQVGACFNQMVRDIKNLIDNNYVMALREKESELTALQAQINPHFLYNTLDALYWQVQNAGNEEIAEDILALSNLFRLVLGRGKGIITVREEEELINQYLQVQKMRFTKRLNYEIEMEEEILDAYIPKLILQPFVENAIVHGFENTATNCVLSVSGHAKSGNIEFRIRDTGVGMTQEQVDAIWNIEDSRRYSSQRIGRYAIKNVKERLALKYRENFELRIESEVGKGTTVIIVIPMENKEE